MGIGSSPYRALLMVAHKVGELEGIPEKDLLTLIADEIHLTIPLEELLENLRLEKRNPFDPNAAALKDGDALALDEESDEDEDRFILRYDQDC